MTAGLPSSPHPHLDVEYGKCEGAHRRAEQSQSGSGRAALLFLCSPSMSSASLLKEITVGIGSGISVIDDAPLTLSFGLASHAESQRTTQAMCAALRHPSALLAKLIVFPDHVQAIWQYPMNVIEIKL